MNRKILGNLLWSSTFHFAVNCLFAFALVWAVEPSQQDWAFSFLAVLAALILLPLAFRLKNFIAVALLLYFRRKKMRDLIRAEMRLGSLPTTDDYPYFDGDEYLNAVKNDASLNPDQRIKAAELLSALQSVRQYSMVSAIALNAAIEGAILDRIGATEA